MPDNTYHPREVLRNQEKNRKQKYSSQTTGKNWKINRKILINDNTISELRTRFKADHSTPLFIKSIFFLRISSLKFQAKTK